MALTEAQVVEALRPVEDPEIHRSIVELDMVRGVRIDGGAVAVQIALTVAGCPMRTEITQRVTAAVEALDGVSTVEVELVVMTPEELNALRAKLGGGQHSGHGGHTHAQGRGGETIDAPFLKAGSKTRILAIASGKGGVGKSSVTVNLAIALSRLGHEVGIMDADIYGFSIPKMLDADVQPELAPWSDEREQVLLPVPAHGVRIMSMGNLMPDDQVTIWRGPMLHQMLREFLTRVWWGEPDFLLVDMPPGTGDVPLSVAQYLPSAEVYVVTTPNPSAQRVAQRAGLMARKEQINQPVMGVIENMSWFTGDDGKRYELFGRGGGQALADELDVPLLAQLPFVPAIGEGGDVGAPITVTDPTSEASVLFEALAKHVEATAPPKPKQRFRPELRVQ